MDCGSVNALSLMCHIGALLVRVNMSRRDCCACVGRSYCGASICCLHRY